jgi:hypothetical protein
MLLYGSFSKSLTVLCNTQLISGGAATVACRTREHEFRPTSRLHLPVTSSDSRNGPYIRVPHRVITIRR